MTGTQRHTIEAVERRRSELLGVTFFVLIGFALLSILLTFLDGGSAWLDQLGGGLNIVRVCLVLLTIAFAWYVHKQQSDLRRVTQELMDERVVVAALQNRVRELSALADGASRDLESSLTTILSTVNLLDQVGELPEADRAALADISRRAEGLVLAADEFATISSDEDGIAG